VQSQEDDLHFVCPQLLVDRRIHVDRHRLIAATEQRAMDRLAGP